ncbi:ribbon-helix-helix domain-containing protein [Candidatus Woesearchaeota archaeon]|nr:ribbon-helix-helix domain-containing protein [Candidatus Woesearchaeota archaeon]
MDVLTVKFQPNIMKKIDKAIKQNNYNSKTEFIRDAVRNKLEEIEREIALKKFMELQGRAGKITTDEENEKTRELVGKQILAKYKKKIKNSQV